MTSSVDIDTVRAYVEQHYHALLRMLLSFSLAAVAFYFLLNISFLPSPLAAGLCVAFALAAYFRTQIGMWLAIIVVAVAAAYQSISYAIVFLLGCEALIILLHLLSEKEERSENALVLLMGVALAPIHLAALPIIFTSIIRGWRTAVKISTLLILSLLFICVSFSQVAVDGVTTGLPVSMVDNIYPEFGAPEFSFMPHGNYYDAGDTLILLFAMPVLLLLLSQMVGWILLGFIPGFIRERFSDSMGSRLSASLLAAVPPVIMLLPWMSVIPDNILIAAGAGGLISGVLAFGITSMLEPPAGKPGISRRLSPEKHPWENIGGLENIRAQLYQMCRVKLGLEKRAVEYGIKAPSAVLLYGPQGCGKTLLTKTCAAQCNVNFIQISGSEPHKNTIKHVGRKFGEAFSLAPSVLFIDDLDRLLEQDGMSSEFTNLISQHANERLMLIGATERPDKIDKMLLTQDRFESLLFVPAPDKNARAGILKMGLRDKDVDEDVDFARLADMTDGYTAEDILSICSKAVLMALDETSDDALSVGMRHLEETVKSTESSLSRSLMSYYDRMQETYVVQDETAVGATCPYCGGLIKATSSVVTCEFCDTPHHQECWDANKGCTTYGCKMAPGE